VEIIEMQKDVLIKEIKDNMETHQETYEKAVEAFKAEQVKLLEGILEKAKKGKEFDRFALSRLPVPENHLADYKRALKMLGHEVKDTVELSQTDYCRYVLDEWEWQHSFTTNTASYIR
jgi:hypothetical protein